MGNSLLNGLSGLLAAERAIATTSHNIANANTEGYSRQRVNQAARLADTRGALFEGSGVKTSSIGRVHDDLIETRLQSVTSEYSRIESQTQVSNQINALFSEQNSALNEAHISFFNALEDAANNPHARAPAEHVLSTANALKTQYNFLDGRLNSIQSELNFAIQNKVTSINELASGIVAVNRQIATATSADTNNPPSDLLDKRDTLLQELSGYVTITTLPRSGMGLDVAMANGVPLVSLAGASTLLAVKDPSDPDKLSFEINTNEGNRAISTPTGGSLGGLIEMSSGLLEQSRADLGQLAAGIAFAINDAYEEIDPANAADPLTRSEFFTESLATPVSNSNNQGTASIAIELIDPGQTTNSGYSMVYDGSGYILTRISDRMQISGGASLTMDGIVFTANGTAVAGDSFLIKPFSGVASSIEVKPVDIKDLSTMVGSTTQQYIPVSQMLADIRETNIFNQGTTTIGEHYATLVSAIGSATRTNEVQLKSMDSIMESTLDRHDQLSGVSLDEEAANLIKYQQAYEASARVMVASGTMFDTLLSVLN